MSEGKTSLFYVVATICVLLSVTLAANGLVSAESFDHARQSVSAMLNGIVVPGGHGMDGTLYDTYCSYHDAYFGLRF